MTKSIQRLTAERSAGSYRPSAHSVQLCDFTTGNLVRYIAFCDDAGRAAYIAHAANAYPKLVEAVNDLAATVKDLLDCDTSSESAASEHAEAKRIVREKLALLRELGELN